MQYYHFRSTRSVFTDLEDCDDSNKRRPKTVLWSISSKQIYYPYESKFLACCFAFFKWARLRRAGDKRVGVSRSTPASFSMKHAKVLQTSKFLIIYTTPVVHWPAWLSDQSEFWCLLHSPMRNRERRRKLERKGVPNIKLFLGSFFCCCCCFFVYFVFVCFFFRSLLTVPEVYAEDSVSCWKKSVNQGHVHTHSNTFENVNFSSF